MTAGNYSVTVFDDNNCQVSQAFTILDGSKIQPNEIVNNEACSGDCDGTIILNPSGGTGTYSYLWDTGETTISRSNLCGGTYTVTISDGGNCDTILSLTINSNPVLVATVKTKDQSCTNLTVCDGEAYVTVTGGAAPYTYLWPAGTINGLTNDTALSLCKGNYDLTITDASGCSIIENYSIDGPPPIAAFFTVVEPLCNISNGSVTVTASGGSSANYTYEWFNSSMVSIGTTNTINSISSGIYFVEIADGTGCSDRFSVGVSDRGAEAVSMSKVDASCAGSCDGEATASFVCLDPNCTIAWFDAATGSPIGITTATANGLCAGDYYVEVTNNNGCKAIDSVSINEPDQFLVSSNSINPSCFGSFDGSISLTVSGGSGSYNYIWSPGPLTGQGTANVSQLNANTYSVLISDGNGCDTTLSFILKEPSEINISFTTIDATCGQADGFINGAVT